MKHNWKDLYERFEDFDGGMELTVRRDDWVKGDPKNDWRGVFDEFAAQIRGSVGRENHSILI